MTRYNSLIIDVDSTLTGIEGIDFLARRSGPEVGERIARLTDRAMAGEIALDRVYGERLAIVRPGVDDLRALADAYIAALAPGAGDAIVRLRGAGVRVVLVSGGLRQAILPLARTLGFADDDVRAVDVHLDEAGRFAGWDERSPLATQDGKAEVARALTASGALPRPILAVGDGATDLAMREAGDAVDAFAAFTGYVRREKVVAAADLEVASFAALADVTLQGLGAPPR